MWESEKKTRELRATVRPGLSLICRPRISADKKYITLSMKIDVQNVDQWEEQEDAAGKTTAPLMSREALQTTVRIPNGGTVFLGGSFGKSSLFLVSAEIVEKESPSFHNSGEPRGAKIR